VAYQGPLEDPYVAAYDHATAEWSGPFKAGESILGKTPGAKIDNHGKPEMIIDNAGYIHLFFGGHGGLPRHGTNPLGDTHNGQQIHVVSRNPQDISSWEVLDNIPPFGTYDQVVKMDPGKHTGERHNGYYMVMDTKDHVWRNVKGEVLIRRKKTGFAITSLIRNAHPDAQVIAIGKSGKTDFRKAYLLGDHGPVKRPKDEADQIED